MDVKFDDMFCSKGVVQPPRSETLTICFHLDGLEAMEKKLIEDPTQSWMNMCIQWIRTFVKKDNLPDGPQRKSEVVDVGSSSWIVRVKLEIFLQTWRHDVWYINTTKFSDLRQVYRKIVLLSKRLNFCQTLSLVLVAFCTARKYRYGNPGCSSSQHSRAIESCLWLCLKTPDKCSIRTIDFAFARKYGKTLTRQT